MTFNDYSHFVSGRYVYTEKVPYGYNYYDLNHQIVDRYTDGQHGMHVAGTVAANGRITGVAPEAQLLAMKVFSDDLLTRSTFSDIYLKAIDDSVELGANAINMSLGSPAGFYVMDSLEDKAINNARDNGITVAISAGNERNSMNGSSSFAAYLGVYYTNQAKNPDNGVVGSPSVNPGALSVASFENVGYKAYTLSYTIDDTTAKTGMIPAPGSPSPFLFAAPMELVYAGLGYPADFAGKDLDGKIALIRRGTLNFAVKLANATAAGAAGVIVFNNAGESLITMAGGDQAAIPFVFIGQTAGSAMAEALQADPPKTVTVTFNDDLESIVNPTGGQLSSFSSWGSTPDLKLKPEISAPGGMIYSTQNGDTYGTMSGTSMAAPHVAGGAALVSQHLRESDLFGGLSGMQTSALTKTLLMNTAIPQVDQYGLWYSSRQQGAGMMNVANAIASTVTATDTKTGEAKLELGEFNRPVIIAEMTLRNYGAQPQSFTAETILLRDYYNDLGGGYYASAEVSFDVPHTPSAPRTITVPANGSKKVKITINFDEALGTDPATSMTLNQFLGGFLRFHSTNDMNPDLTVPLLGFYGDWDAPKVLDEWRTNVFDADPTNDPEFVLTSLVRINANGGATFLDNRAPIRINPTSENNYNDITRNNTLGLLATVLRNAWEINFRVVDAKGNLLRNIGQSRYVTKIYRMAQGAVPYRFFSSGEWDGLVAGRTFAEGDTVYYEIEILRTSISKPETYRFPVRFDNLGPQINNLTYNEAAATLELDVTDAGTGVSDVNVFGAEGRSINVNYTGSEHFSIDVSTLLSAEESVLQVEALDGLYNYTVEEITVPGTAGADSTPEQTPVDSPEAPVPGEGSDPEPVVTPVREDDEYGRPEIALFTPDLLTVYNNPVTFSGFAYGWENITKVTVTLNGVETILDTVRKEKFSARNGDAELFFGNVWVIDDQLEIADGYHEMPITVYNGDNEEETFNIVRQFWVDTTPPEITHSLTRKGSKAEITLEATDNLFYLALYQENSLLEQKFLEDLGNASTDVSITKKIPVTLTKGENVFNFHAFDSYGNKTTYTVTISN